MAGLEIIEVKLPPFIAKEQLIRPGVQLEEVDFAIVGNGADDRLVAEVLDLERLEVEQESNDLGGLARLPVGDLGGDEAVLHVFRSASPERLIVPVLDEGQLAGVEYHADVLVGEIKFFVASAAPGDFGLLVSLDVADDERLVCPGDSVTVFLNVNFVDFCRGAPDDGFLAVLEHLDDNLARSDVVQVEFAFVPDFLHGNVEHVN